MRLMPKQLVQFIFTLLFFFTGANALAQNNWQVLPGEIEKSANDPRQYQAITLKNNMTVLLISDKTARKSAAAVSLAIGSMDEPQSQAGLAHYLEHMVLMGSKRFPEPGNFSDYLAKHGGSHNASTGSNYTDFYFEVENNALKGATERLADALAEPLLDPVNADKERNAVNAELTMARSRDGHRMYQVRAETWNPAHPISRFSGGNLETLRDKPGSILHEELLKFYNTYYSSNLMKAVIYGPESPEELAKLANETFGTIPDRHATVPQITVPLITAAEQQKIIHYVPAQPQKSLDFEFVIDNNSKDFRKQTDTYIAYLLGSRSEGTLANWLISKGLAESVSASASSTLARNQGVFIISVSLTDEGMAKRDEITAAIFAYLNLIKEKGINKDYFDEIARVNMLAFRYSSVVRDMNYVESLANTMMEYPVKNVLNVGYLADDWDPAAIKARLADLTPEKARVWYTSPQEPSNKKAYFVDAPYQVDAVTAAQLDKWRKSEGDFRFSLPALNPFIPDNFDLIKQQEQQKPVQLTDTAKLRLFYMPSRYFADEPKAIIALELRNRNAGRTAKDVVTSALLSYVSELKLNQLSYQASVAGMGINISDDDGLNISVSGYSQHLPELLTTAVSEYQSFTPSASELAQAKSWYREQVAVSDNGKAYEMAMRPFSRLKSVPYFEDKERLAALDTITESDITQYRDCLIREGALQMFVFGNLTAPQAEQIASKAQAQLGSQGTEWWVGDYYVIDKALKPNFDEKANSTDNALANIFIPDGYSRTEGAAFSSVLSKILHPWFYDQLRTQEQLGYALFAFNPNFGRQWGIGFLLQSNEKNPAYLSQRFDDFYINAEKRLKALDNAEFDKYRNALLTEMTQPPETFEEEASRYSFDFKNNYFDFNTREQTIAAVKKMTKQDVVTFYENAVMSKKGLALYSQVTGTGGKADDYAKLAGWTTYPSVTAFQALLPVKEEIR
ncbi:pitrilysin [Morganella morganii]|uniref:pitrilysin n=1 Tax=Morganella morganii TaxID=582 RepID=UPI0033116018